LNLLILELLPFEGFSASFDLTDLNPSKEAGNSQWKTHSYSGFHVYELVIPERITIYPVEGECCQSTDEKTSGR
jgi:hypothetical protein